jgi:hypothetical protein
MNANVSPLKSVYVQSYEKAPKRTFILCQIDAGSRHFQSELLTAGCGPTTMLCNYAIRDEEGNCPSG